MGNPAGERRKKKEKRRAKLEKRLGIGAFAEKSPRVHSGRTERVKAAPATEASPAPTV